jgi:hypothetical protein
MWVIPQRITKKNDGITFAFGNGRRNLSISSLGT